MILVQKQKYKSGKKVNGLANVSGTRLAEALGIKIYTPKIVPKWPTNMVAPVINYGCSNIPWLAECHKVINNPEAIAKACDKIETFRLLDQQDISIPPFATNKEAASYYFNHPEKQIVFCRTLLNSSKGRGIVISHNPDELVEAPLYTLYIPKNEEYRVHVAFHDAIHIQKKKKLTPEELLNREIVPISPLIRNSSNGYVFSSNIDLEGDKLEAIVIPAIQSVQALGLDFGAVDLIVGKDGNIYVLEVNTAPGIEEVTLERYVEAFKNEVDSYDN